MKRMPTVFDKIREVLQQTTPEYSSSYGDELDPAEMGEIALEKRTTFNEQLHRRDARGRFTRNPNSWLPSAEGLAAVPGKLSSAAKEARQRILHGAPDTQHLWGRTIEIDGKQKTFYSKAREGLHSSIIEDLRRGVGRSHRKKPLAIFMAGGSGTGKSTLIKMLKAEDEDLRNNSVTIDPDKVKAKLPEFDELRGSGDVWAAQAVHEESSDVTKQLVAMTLEDKQDMILDGVGDSDPGKFAKKIQEAIDAGYDVKVIWATCDVEEAIKRCDKRGSTKGGPDEGRFVDHGEIRRNHAEVAKRQQEIIAAKPGDPAYGAELMIFDTSGPEDAVPELIFLRASQKLPKKKKKKEES